MHEYIFLLYSLRICTVQNPCQMLFSGVSESGHSLNLLNLPSGLLLLLLLKKNDYDETQLIFTKVFLYDSISMRMKLLRVIKNNVLERPTNLRIMSRCGAEMKIYSRPLFGDYTLV